MAKLEAKTDRHQEMVCLKIPSSWERDIALVELVLGYSVLQQCKYGHRKVL